MYVCNIYVVPSGGKSSGIYQSMPLNLFEMYRISILPLVRDFYLSNRSIGIGGKFKFRLLG